MSRTGSDTMATITVPSHTIGSLGSLTLNGGSYNGDEKSNDDNSPPQGVTLDSKTGLMYQMVNVSINGVYKNLLVPVSTDGSTSQNSTLDSGEAAQTLSRPVLINSNAPRQAKLLTSPAQRLVSSSTASGAGPGTVVIVPMNSSANSSLATQSKSQLTLTRVTSGVTTIVAPSSTSEGKSLLTLTKVSPGVTTVVTPSTASVAGVSTPVIKMPSSLTLTPSGARQPQPGVSLLKQAISTRNPSPNVLTDRRYVGRVPTAVNNSVAACSKPDNAQNPSKVMTLQNLLVPPVEAVKRMIRNGMLKVPAGCSVYISPANDGKVDVHVQKPNGSPTKPKRILPNNENVGSSTAPLFQVPGALIRTVNPGPLSTTCTVASSNSADQNKNKPMIVIPVSSPQNPSTKQIILVPTSQTRTAASVAPLSAGKSFVNYVPSSTGSKVSSDTKVLYAMSSAPVTQTVTSLPSNIGYSSNSPLLSPVCTVPPINILPTIKTEPQDGFTEPVPPADTTSIEEENSPMSIKIDSVFSLSEQKSDLAADLKRERTPSPPNIAPSLPDDHPGVITIQPDMSDPEMPTLVPEFGGSLSESQTGITIKEEPGLSEASSDNNNISDNNLVQGDNLQVCIGQQVAHQIAQSTQVSAPNSVPTLVPCNSVGQQKIRIVMPKQIDSHTASNYGQPVVPRIVRNITSPTKPRMPNSPNSVIYVKRNTSITHSPDAIKIVSNVPSPAYPGSCQYVTIKPAGSQDRKAVSPGSVSKELKTVGTQFMSPSSQEFLGPHFYKNLMKALLPPDTIDEDFKKHLLPDSFSSAAREFAQDTIKTSRFTTSRSVAHFPVSPNKQYIPPSSQDDSVWEEEDQPHKVRVFYKKNSKKLTKGLRRANKLPETFQEWSTDIKPSFVPIPKVRITDIRKTVNLDKVEMKDIIDSKPVKKRKRKHRRKVKNPQKAAQFSNLPGKSGTMLRLNTSPSPMQSLLKPGFVKQYSIQPNKPQLGSPPLVTVANSGQTITAGHVVQHKMKYYLIKTSNQTFLVPMSAQLDAAMKQNPSVASTLIQAALRGKNQVLVSGTAGITAPPNVSISKPPSGGSVVPKVELPSHTLARTTTLVTPSLPSTTPVAITLSSPPVPSSPVYTPPGFSLLKSIVPKSEPATNYGKPLVTPLSPEVDVVGEDKDRDECDEASPPKIPKVEDKPLDHEAIPSKIPKVEDKPLEDEASPPKIPKVDDKPLDTKSRIELLKARLREQEAALLEVRKNREESKKVLETIDLL